MPRVGVNLYPLAACVQWTIDYWKKRAEGRDAGGQSLTNREKAARVSVAEAKAMQMLGTSVSKVEVAQAAEAAYLQMGKFLESLPSSLARDCNLNNETVRKMRARLDDARNNFARDLEPHLPAEKVKRARSS
jgi:hypothetical protein